MYCQRGQTPHNFKIVTTDFQHPKVQKTKFSINCEKNAFCGSLDELLTVPTYLIVQSVFSAS